MADSDSLAAPVSPLKSQIAQTFMSNIRDKFPMYSDIPDDILLQKVVKKYPQYQDIAQKEFGTVTKTPPNLTDMAQGLANNPEIRSGVSTVESTMMPLEKSGRLLTPAITGAVSAAEALAVSPGNRLDAAKEAFKNPQPGKFAKTEVDSLQQLGIKGKAGAAIGGTLGTILDAWPMIVDPAARMAIAENVKNGNIAAAEFHVKKFFGVPQETDLAKVPVEQLVKKGNIAEAARQNPEVFKQELAKRVTPESKPPVIEPTVAGFTGVEEAKPAGILSNQSGKIPTPDFSVIDKSIESMSPVKNAPTDQRRAIIQNNTDKNLSSFHIDQTTKSMKSLVPDPAQRAIIAHHIESGGKLFDDQMAPQMKQVADMFRYGTQKSGELSASNGVIKGMLDNYVPHITAQGLSPEEVTSQMKMAVSSGKMSKFVYSGLPRVRTESGEVVFPTILSLKQAGIPVVSEDIADLYQHTMNAQATANANVKLLKQLKELPYGKPEDSLKQVMSGKDKPAKGYQLAQGGVFTGHWVSPEAYPSVASMTEQSALAKNPVTKSLMELNSKSKAIKAGLVPMFHGWNFYRNAVATRGIVGGTKLFIDGAKALRDPQETARLIGMGTQLFRINQMGGQITDEILGFQGNNALAKVLKASNDALFVGMGDNLIAGMTRALEKKYNGKIPKEAFNEVLTDFVSQMAGNQPDIFTPQLVKDLGNLSLFARKWTMSNINIGAGAISKATLPKYWTRDQKAMGMNLRRAAILRGVIYGLVTAQIINYASTKRATGVGLTTFQNKGDWKSKITPIAWVDKKTGKQYPIYNWYGFIKDIVGWPTNFGGTLKNKLSFLVSEGLQQMLNEDWHNQHWDWKSKGMQPDVITQKTDNLVEAIGHRVMHAVKAGGEPIGLSTGKLSKDPLAVKAIRLGGFSTYGKRSKR